MPQAKASLIAFAAVGVALWSAPALAADYFAGKPGMAPRPVQSTLDLTKLAAVGFEAADADHRLREYLAE